MIHAHMYLYKNHFIINYLELKTLINSFLFKERKWKTMQILVCFASWS